MVVDIVAEGFPRSVATCCVDPRKIVRVVSFCVGVIVGTAGQSEVELTTKVGWNRTTFRFRRVGLGPRGGCGKWC